MKTSEELIKQQCINDFKQIISGINLKPDFDGIQEDIAFYLGIWEYKQKLIERLEKYLEEK